VGSSPEDYATGGCDRFLRNQITGIWAADLFVVQTVGFQTFDVDVSVYPLEANGRSSSCSNSA